MSWRTALLDLLYPPRCPFCRRLLERSGDLLCPECQRTLPWLTGSAAERKLEFVSLCAAPLRYRGAVRESVRRYKFSGMYWYSKPYGVLAAQCAQDHLAGRYDLVCWVPVSAWRRWRRGYDQSRLLAIQTAAHLGVEAVDALRKVKHNRPQSSIRDSARRRANVLGAYRVKNPALVRDKRVLLIDDVVTTGSTLSECARTLRMAGARDVVCLTLARAG